VTGKILPFDGPAYHAEQELLPWYVAGTLPSDEHAAITAHLEGCALCQHEVESLRLFHAAYAERDAPGDPGPAFARLAARIGREGRASPPRGATAGWALPRWLAGSPVWTAAAAVVLVGIVAFVAVEADQGGAQYRTLGAATASPAPAEGGARFAVVFDPRTTEGRLREIVRDSGARIVDGPTASAAYVLETTRDRGPAALAALRAASGVVLAEPLEVAR
jgi:hypothetical protein